MTVRASTVVAVARRERNGWFVYTSDDIPGLYVAHQDDRVAYNDLPASIRLLVKLNDRIDCQVTHALSYAEFVRIAQPHNKQAQQTDDLMIEHGDMIKFILQPNGVHQTL